MATPTQIKRRGRWGLILGGVLIALLLGAAALADNTEADGDITDTALDALAYGTVCIGKDTSAPVNVLIRRTGSGTNVFKDGSTATVSVLSATTSPGSGTLTATVPASPGNQITLPANWADQLNNTLSPAVSSTVTLNATTSGSGTISYRSSGINSSNNAIQRDGTLSVTWTAVTCDTTPPIITKTITGTAGTGGWYGSDVTVEWTVTDPDSTVVVDSGCGIQTFTSETAGTTSSCQAHSAGGSSSDSVTIKIDKTKPVISATATKADSSPYVADTWTNQNVTVSFTCADAGTVSSGLATNTVAGATLATETATGSVTNTGACTDTAGNSADPNTFSPIKIDKTKPVISATATKADSSPYVADTWTNQDVTVSFSCADDAGPANSGLASDTVGGGGTQSDETATGSFTSTGGCTDIAGNSATAKTFGPIKIDKTKPVISASAKKADNSPYVADTWTNQSVTVAFTCADDAGTVNSGPATNTVVGATLSGDTATGSVTNTGVCTDNAGNSANPKTFSPIKIDKTPPSLNITGAADGTNYNVCGAGPGRPTFSPSDSLSGLDGAEGDSWTTPGTPSGVGTYTYNAHAKDNAGNTTSETRTYKVLYGAAIGDFLQPINMDGSSRFKLGSTIPVKFQAFCGTTPVSAVVARLNIKKADGTPDPGVDEAVSTAASTTGNLFRWTGSPDNQHIFNVSTKSGYTNPGGTTVAFSVGTWTLSALLDDGTFRSVSIQIPR